MIRILSRQLAAALLAGLIVGCSKDNASSTRSSSDDSKRASAKTEDSSAGTVDLGGGSYKPVALSAMGSVSGIIKLNGTPPADTTSITVDQAHCGTTVPSSVSVAKSGGLADAVVWIADVKSGKSFPIEKRAELSSQNCLLDPRVQAAVVGTTVNVFNDDKAIHRLAFTRLGTHDTLTVMEFFNVGQVVASERLATEPGIVEIRCAQHPWTRGYIVVFDHPYFAVTDDAGSFKMDSLPPGSYKMMVWHEGMAKPVEQQVQVAANGSAKVALAVRLASAQ